ncbi:MAG: peptidoglycan bridge formation glycyltransferase FemA/FemB family protein, partial [Clostridia bacterium]|nr:peptidoglycan bridge formation glycyltransferase FemA/FemB family protein [Clostridia bacterium]
ISGDLDESNPLYGLYRFKKGFCPEITEFIGDFYYVYNPLVYNGMEFAQKLRKKLRKGH